MSENVEKVEIADEDITENDFSPEELESEETDWKAKAQELKGLNKRRAAKLAKAKEALAKIPKEPEHKPALPTEKQGFDYGEMAYLEAKGISDEDYPIVLEAMKATGKSLRDTVGSKYIQAEIKEAKDARATKEAIPSGTRRAGAGTKDSVDYWVAQGKLPPDNPELASQVLKARIEAEEKKRSSPNP